MGMFTRVIHPVTKEEIQIHTGDDQLQTYKVGDKVDRDINPNEVNSGCCFDGCYCGYRGYHPDCLVIIDKQIIKEVVDDPELFKYYYNKYREKIPYSEYTYVAIIKYFIREGKGKINNLIRGIKNKRLRRSFIKTYGEEEGSRLYMSYILSAPLRRKLDYQGLASQLLKVEEWPDGIPVIFDKIKK